MQQLQRDAGEALTRLIVENLGEALLVFEAGTKRVLFSNRAAAGMVGHADPAAHGLKCHEIFLRRDRPCDAGEEGCLLDRAASSKTTVRRAHDFFTADGEEGTADMVATLIPGGSHERRRVIISVRDITEPTRKILEATEHLRDAEESSRLRALLTDIVGHDILNPASVIRYSVDILRRGESDHRRRLLWEMLERNLSFIIKIVENVSLYSHLEKAEGMEYRSTDICTVIDGVLASLERDLREKSLQVAFRRAGTCQAMVNPMMEDVFMNVLANAVRHSPAEGLISVSIRDGGDRWIVSICDEGGGVPDEFKESIFERFTSMGGESSRGRLGLGLSIARRIMDLHGGSIQVRDAPGQGADFRVGIMKRGPANSSSPRR